MPNEFYLAAIPEPVTILGVKLRPFSLGHVILLHRVESSFVTGGDASYDDLAISVFICSQKYRDALAAFDDKLLPKLMRKWAKKLGVVDLAAKSDEFAQYIRNGSKIPYYSFSPNDVGSSQVEPVQSVKVALMSKMRFAEDELLDRPWGLCLWDYVTMQAMEGKLQICERDDISNAVELAKHLAEKFANGAPVSHS